jgi:hypothetical protein
MSSIFSKKLDKALYFTKIKGLVSLEAKLGRWMAKRGFGWLRGVDGWLCGEMDG